MRTRWRTSTRARWQRAGRIAQAAPAARAAMTTLRSPERCTMAGTAIRRGGAQRRRILPRFLLSPTSCASWGRWARAQAGAAAWLDTAPINDPRGGSGGGGGCCGCRCDSSPSEHTAAAERPTRACAGAHAKLRGSSPTRAALSQLSLR